MRLLELANTQLDHALRQNIQLTDAVAAQSQALLSLQSDNAILKAHIQRLEEGTKHQLEVIAGMERRLNAMEGKYDRIVGQLFQEQVRNGKDPELPT